MQQIQVSPAEAELKALEASVKTMRKTGLYGYNTKVNVEWPTANDLLQMVKNIPKKIKDLKY